MPLRVFFSRGIRCHIDERCRCRAQALQRRPLSPLSVEDEILFDIMSHAMEITEERVINVVRRVDGAEDGCVR